jgi:hypothetical protein
LGSVAGCGVYCTSGSQCKSGCCAPLKSGKSVCAAETYCQ